MFIYSGIGHMTRVGRNNMPGERPGEPTRSLQPKHRYVFPRFQFAVSGFYDLPTWGNCGLYVPTPVKRTAMYEFA